MQDGMNMKLSDERGLWISKVLAVVYGAICFGFVYVAKYMPGVLEVDKQLR